MTSAIATLTPAPSTTAQSDTTGLADDFDTFLVLLTEQLQNQDPLEPMDSTQFVTQLVEFSSVEQQIKQNDNLEQMVSMQSSTIALTASTYVGTSALVRGSTAELPADADAAGFANAKWAYEMNGGSNSTTITIRDGNNAIVYETAGETLPGVHEFEWDGLDADGVAVEPGNYTIDVTAEDEDGNSLSVTTAGRRRIDGVDFSSTTYPLIVGGETIALSDVIQLGG